MTIKKKWKVELNVLIWNNLQHKVNEKSKV